MKLKYIKEMKSLKFIFSLLVWGCLALASCKTDVNISNQLSLIPGNASIVCEINGKEILAKSGLNSPDDYRFMGWLKMFSADVYNYLASLFRGSKEAGISAEKILIYAVLPDFVVTFPMLDKAKYESWLKKVGMPEPSVEEKFSYISENGFSMAWNDNLVTISSAKTREQIAEQFNLKDDGLLATNIDFQEFAKKETDIRLWFPFASIIELYKSTLFTQIMPVEDSIMNTFGEDLENISAHSYLNFDDGKITGLACGYPPEEVEKLQAKYPVLKQDFNKKILKDMPEQSYMAVNIAINVKEYFTLFRQNIEKVIENSKGFYGYDIEEKSAELFEFFDSPELNSVVEALAGDAIISIHGFNQGLISYPLAGLSFTVNGESAFKSILSLIPKDFYHAQDSYYIISANKTFIPVYFAYKDSKIFVSNDLDATKKFTTGHKEKTFADNPIAKIMMADKMVFYLNLNFDAYPNNIKMLLQSFMQNNFSRFVSLIEIYEGMYFTNDANYNTEYTLQLKNKNVNSLKQIFKSIDASIISWIDSE
ncbi:MAG: DUF4836 family protein [Prevotellaceae bacterium]|jgi:hypothetical protein|nr:DUF4836 family protein [Prevotellaceae bacterium]